MLCYNIRTGMLNTLTIVNYALIEHLEIEFKDGFSVITGETGAGKSIILGALSLILGSRADLQVLRDKNKKCIIEGIFDNGNIDLESFFNDNNIDYDDHTIIRRELSPSGKSRAFINDTPVNLKLIVYLGNKFVNIHSQHQTLQLSNTSFQLDVLDDFIGKPKPLKDYQDIYSQYHEKSEQLRGLTNQNIQAKKDRDYIEFQFNELSSITLDSEELSELETKARYLENNEEIKLALSEAESILNSEENSLISSISGLIKVFENVEAFLPGAEKLLERLNSVSIELADIASEVEIRNSNDEFNPAELQMINEKLYLIYGLIQKHNVSSVDELLSLREEYDNKLQRIESLDDDISGLTRDIEIIKSKLKKEADRLTDMRSKAGNSFAKSVLDILKKLGMKDAEIKVKLEKLPDFSYSGIDKVLFLFNANVGVEPGEISQIASGGELSRLMLAIKSLVNQRQMLPTVIFDEIDSGVSGEIAGKVGSIIKKMAGKHQVISITHLPQIASKADHHYKVRKHTSNNTTVTVIDELTDNERIDELAGMLSSEKVTKSALETAREMLRG